VTRSVSGNLVSRSGCVVVVAALATLLASCESLVGIHDARVLGEGGASAVGTGAGGGAGARPSMQTGEEAGRGTTDTSDTSGLYGSIGPDASVPPVEGSPADHDAGRIGARDGLPDAGGLPPSESQGSTVPPDDGAEPGGSLACEPAPPSRAGTAFLFTAGPNGGNAAGAGSCAFPNSELPGAPRFYGAVEPALMDTPASLCGACLRLEYGAASVEVTVIDVIEPNPLAHGHTLSVDAEARRSLSRADQNLDVLFSVVPCTAADTIRLQFANAGDPSVLVLDHRNPLASVTLSTPGVAVPLVRQDYNFWTPPRGFSQNGDLVSLTLADTAGNELSVPNVRVGTAIVDTGVQFSALGCFAAP
jgi:hypothetical protein